MNTQDGNIFETPPADNPMPKIVIEIKGGAVQNVYCNKDANVMVIDLDELQLGQDPISEVRTISKNDLGIRRIIQEAQDDYKIKQNENRKTA